MSKLIFNDTIGFSPVAVEFAKYGKFTRETPNTRTYDQFWDEEMNRCLNGYSYNGVHITGHHYYYLNYTQIKATKFDTNDKIKRKGLTFPRFLDIDYDYFDIIKRARELRKGVCMAKARRKGFSYKIASEMSWTYHFVDASETYITAYDSEYSDSTMAFFLTMENFINVNTEWRQRRLIDRTDHIKAGWKEKNPVTGTMEDKGSLSEVMSFSFGKNKSKMIGKSAELLIVEEAGKANNLLEFWGLTEPILKDGEHYIGSVIIFGTGGDMENGTEDFCEIFYNPDKYNFLAFDNIWDDNAEGEKCGWFMPDYRFKLPHVDEHGNSLEEQAKKTGIAKREELLKIGDKKKYDSYVTQEPYTPKEAFTTVVGNIFPVGLLRRQLSFLLRDTEQAQNQRGRFDWVTPDSVKWVPSKDEMEVPYPAKDYDKTGCIIIYEHPIDNPPYGLYIAGLDPYVQDTAENSVSLGSMFVYKRFFSPQHTHDILVAEYTGRPTTSEQFYEKVEQLLLYYNARVLHENMSKDVISYFRNRQKTHLLFEEPEAVIKSLIKSSNVSRSYGIHMTKEIKLAGEQYINDWLVTKRDNENFNLNTIRSIHLINELISYKREKNFDRVMAFMMCIFQIKNMHFQTVETLEEDERQRMFLDFHKKHGFR